MDLSIIPPRAGYNVITTATTHHRLLRREVNAFNVISDELETVAPFRINISRDSKDSKEIVYFNIFTKKKNNGKSKQHLFFFFFSNKLFVSIYKKIEVLPK